MPCSRRATARLHNPVHYHMKLGRLEIFPFPVLPRRYCAYARQAAWNKFEWIWGGMQVVGVCESDSSSELKRSIIRIPMAVLPYSVTVLRLLRCDLKLNFSELCVSRSLGHEISSKFPISRFRRLGPKLQSLPACFTKNCECSLNRRMTPKLPSLERVQLKVNDRRTDFSMNTIGAKCGAIPRLEGALVPKVALLDVHIWCKV